MLKSQIVGFQTLKLFIAQSYDPINTVLKKNEKKKANWKLKAGSIRHVIVQPGVFEYNPLIVCLHFVHLFLAPLTPQPIIIFITW